MNSNYIKKVFTQIYFYNEELFQTPNNIFQAEGCGNLQNALQKLLSKTTNLQTLHISIITGGYNSLGSKRINNYKPLNKQNTFLHFIVINNNPDINFIKQLGHVYYIEDNNKLLTVTRDIVDKLINNEINNM